MTSWNRIDYDRLEREGRWQLALVSTDPIRGVPPWLILHLLLSLGLLAAWSNFA